MWIHSDNQCVECNETVYYSVVLQMYKGSALCYQLSQRVTAGFRREGDESCALLGCYAPSSGNFLIYSRNFTH